MGWDWTFVGELAVGLSVGIGVGGYAFAHSLEVAALRIAAHPSVRKLANAADKLGNNATGGWPGLLGGFLNLITGGRFNQASQGALPGAGGLGPGEALVMNEAGEIVGKARIQ